MNNRASIIQAWEFPLLAEFLQCQLSNETKRAYGSDLLLLEQFIKQHFTLENITQVKTQHLAIYREYLHSNKKAIASINRKIACAKSYFAFLSKNKIIQEDPSINLKSYPKPDNANTQGLTNQEVTKLLSMVRLDTDSGRMHSAILHLLFYLGLRRGEICAIQVKDFCEISGVNALRIHGKGNRTRVLPLTQKIIGALQLYLKYAPIKHSNFPLFASHVNPGKHLHPNTITNIIKSYAKKAGIQKRISPHSARATCISNALENGASLIQVQQLGGWQSFDMVLRYDKRRQALKNSAVNFVEY